MMANEVEHADSDSVEIMTTKEGRPFVLTRWRGLFIATIACAGTAWGASVLFQYVAHQTNIMDGRTDQVSQIFTAIMGLLWLGAVVVMVTNRKPDDLAAS